MNLLIVDKYTSLELPPGVQKLVVAGTILEAIDALIDDRFDIAIVGYTTAGITILKDRRLKVRVLVTNEKPVYSFKIDRYIKPPLTVKEVFSACEILQRSF